MWGYVSTIKGIREYYQIVLARLPWSPPVRHGYRFSFGKRTTCIELIQDHYRHRRARKTQRRQRRNRAEIPARCHFPAPAAWSNSGGMAELRRQCPAPAPLPNRKMKPVHRDSNVERNGITYARQNIRPTTVIRTSGIMPAPSTRPLELSITSIYGPFQRFFVFKLSSYFAGSHPPVQRIERL